MTNGNDEKVPARGDKPPRDRRREVLGLRIAIIVLAAVGIALGVLLSGGDDEGEGEEEVPAPRVVSVEELLATAASSLTPVYWAGEQPGTQLELTEEASGYTVLRYIDEGAEPGSESAAALTVGSYPLEDPRGELDVVAARPGAIVQRAEDGRRVVTNEENPTSVYFAGVGNTVQVEVYDPSAQRAMDLALSGEVQPAG